jgi:hypothetical protein
MAAPELLPAAAEVFAKLWDGQTPEQVADYMRVSVLACPGLPPVIINVVATLWPWPAQLQLIQVLVNRLQAAVHHNSHDPASGQISNSK